MHYSVERTDLLPYLARIINHIWRVSSIIFGAYHHTSEVRLEVKCNVPCAHVYRPMQFLFLHAKGFAFVVFRTAQAFARAVQVLRSPVQRMLLLNKDIILRSVHSLHAYDAFFVSAAFRSLLFLHSILSSSLRCSASTSTPCVVCMCVYVCMYVYINT